MSKSINFAPDIRTNRPVQQFWHMGWVEGLGELQPRSCQTLSCFGFYVASKFTTGRTRVEMAVVVVALFLVGRRGVVVRCESRGRRGDGWGVAVAGGIFLSVTHHKIFVVVVFRPHGEPAKLGYSDKRALTVGVDAK